MKIIAYTDPETGAEATVSPSPLARRFKLPPAGERIPRKLTDEELTVLLRLGFVETDEEFLARVAAKDVPRGATDVRFIDAP